MKAVVSQTVFANVATLPKGSRADDITTKLPIQPPGGYAPGEAPVQDHDSNGWPQSPRLAALRLMKKGRRHPHHRRPAPGHDDPVRHRRLQGRPVRDLRALGRELLAAALVS